MPCCSRAPIPVRCTLSVSRLLHPARRGIPRVRRAVRALLIRGDVLIGVCPCSPPEVEIETVSELCHIPPQTPGEHGHLGGHADGHRCCGKSLIESALVGFGVRQHAREASISKRARSTTRTSLRLESTTCSYDSSEKTANCVTPPNVPRSLTGISSIAAAALIVS